ncbi:adenine phosphoribosyltransferase-like [Physella acuta]|uniref:adenine phosphoribosyltransferase-like n=1 Tax=Physella acuta TaxID=109671 RepID=UPI0027DD7DE9|nr:adenine phosphoribosyltransferase-like [Physella acuta]
MADEKLENVRKALTDFPDFPKPGIVFKDIFPILRNPSVFRDLNELILQAVREVCPDVQCVVGLDSRGFLFGPILALELNIPFVPARKKGKLPGELEQVTYMLEYGTDCLEIQKSSINKGQKVLIIDDLLATGGTLKAACELVEKIGGEVVHCLVVVELVALQGRQKVSKPIKSLIACTD